MPRVSHERRAFFYPSKIPGYPKYKGVDAPPGPLLSRVTLPGPGGFWAYSATQCTVIVLGPY